MNQVFAKTRELGEAILNSEEYRGMKACEEKAMKNLTASMTMGEYLQKQNELEKLMNEDHPIPQKVTRLSAEMDMLRERLNAIDDIQRLNEAQSVFSNMIDQVNQVLRFIITGNTPQGDDASQPDPAGFADSCGRDRNRRLN